MKIIISGEEAQKPIIKSQNTELFNVIFEVQSSPVLHRVRTVELLTHMSLQATLGCLPMAVRLVGGGAISQ